jgi:pimeloyl-ACP methyl ester carboxylesterase
MVQHASVPLTTIHRIQADGITVIYREAGPANAPVMLLLHGFPDVLISISRTNPAPR